MLFQLLIPLVNVRSHFGAYKIAEKMCFYPVHSAMALHCVTEVY